MRAGGLMRLKNKVAIVTGAGAGVGEAIAMRFCQEGARVVGCDVSRTGGESVALAIRKSGGEVIFVETDVSSESQVKALVQVALEKFGRIDILVNNAAVLMSYGQIRAHEMSNEEWNRTIDVNLRGYWLCSKYVIPSMLEKKSGSILFIASRTGLRGFPGFAAYSASKGGVLALMRSMAADYAPDGIRINAIIPGTLDTPMNAKEFSEPGARDKYIPRIPARRLGLASDIAGMATFLATDEASFCMGGVYFVDGGADLG
jgi:NAD(P)-dependent dehydrogenase (short-subunit alcohol dehydrogenase family)